MTFLNSRTLQAGFPLQAIRVRAFCWLFSLISTAAVLAQTAEVESAISQVYIENGHLVVVSKVPPGKRRVTLETRSHLKSGSWTPRQVLWTDGSSSSVHFEIPLSAGSELMRTRTESETEIGVSASLFAGANTFAPGVKVNQPIPGGVYTVGTVTAVDIPSGTGTPTRSVVESDIWRIDGQTVYFFNQNRGLQVIHIENLDQPVLTGTLPLLSYGNQMYVLPSANADDSTWLSLIAADNCYTGGNELLLVEVTNGIPLLKNRIPAIGQIQESRLVGQILYLVSSAWMADGGQSTNQSSYRWQTIIQSVDLSDPAHPVLADPLTIPLRADAIFATDQKLVVATTGIDSDGNGVPIAPWLLSNQHAVTVFDIHDPHGAIVELGHVLTTGRVQNKFNLGIENELLTVISQTDGWGYWTNVDTKLPGFGTWISEPVSSVLETFSLSNPSQPTKLGNLTLITGESLYATRIDEKRAYIVTFHRRDPLWLVDLNDPANPTIKGRLDLPGYSTYLEPMAGGTRLLALGSDTGVTTLQLFDVSDIASPKLLSRLPLGTGWSWSEGNSDEKAFKIYPDTGLALLPWQGLDTSGPTNRWFQGIQIVDFDLANGTLTARGVIDHSALARRAALVKDHVISISGTELNSTVVTNRDTPILAATLPLSRQVDRVFLNGSQVLQISDGSNGTSPGVVLSDVKTPDTVLSSIALGTLPVVGASWHNGLLYLLQSDSPRWGMIPVLQTNQIIIRIDVPPFSKLVDSVFTNSQYAPLPSHVQLSILSAEDGKLNWVGSTNAILSADDQVSRWSPYWLADGTLVWSTPPGNRGYYFYPGIVSILPVWGDWYWRGWYGGNWGDVWALAFDVKVPSSPRFMSETQLPGSTDSSFVGDIFTADSKLYLTSARYTPVGWTNNWIINPDGTKVSIDIFYSNPFVESDSLVVADFADAGSPTLRMPLDIPGKLVGLSANGQILEVLGNNATNAADSGSYLHGLAYDGVQASLFSSKSLPDDSFQFKSLADGSLFVTDPGPNTIRKPSLSIWTLSSTGSWQTVAHVELPGNMEETQVYGNLAVATVRDSFWVYDISAGLTLVGKGDRPCWFSLSNQSSDANLTAGLLLALGVNEIWHVDIKP